jgi:integrase
VIIRKGKYWHLRLQFDKTLYQKSLRTESKTEALKLEAAFRTSLVRQEFGIIDGARAGTFKDFEERLLAHFKANCAPRTVGFYRENLAALNKFEPLAKTRLGRIDLSLIERFVQHRLAPRDGDKKRSVVTVNHSLRTLRRALILARDWKLIRDVPRIKLLSGEHQREFVIEEGVLKEMVRYVTVAYPKSPMQFIVPFLCDTGLRVSELCNLRFEDCDLAAVPATITITAGKSKYAKRTIPLTARAVKCLGNARAAARHSSLWAFTMSASVHKKMTRHYPSEQFRTVRDSLGLPPDCVLHSTRHTFATRLGQAGASAFVIQRLCGHSSITISEKYVHSDRAQKEDAIALLNKLNIPAPRSAQRAGQVEEV